MAIEESLATDRNKAIDFYMKMFGNEKMKVLMIGGLACGKTTTLASLFHQMMNSDTNNIFSVIEKSSQNDCEHNKKSLIGKCLELRFLIEKQRTSPFLMPDSPDCYVCDHTLHFRSRMSNSAQSVDIVFREIPGSMWNKYHAQELSKSTADYADYDVYVVCIDTPYLMSDNEKEVRGVNDIESIHAFLMQTVGKINKKAKQIMFVPVKCEKWVKEGRINDVVTAVETFYADTIRSLKDSDKTEISIIPVQTIGGICFKEWLDSYVLFNTQTQRQIPCAKINNEIVRIPDGRYHKISECEMINENVDAYTSVDGLLVKRRDPWYECLSDGNIGYQPANCEQLFLHIIHFMCTRFIKDVSPFLLEDYLGLSQKRRMMMNELLREANKLITDSGGGIKIIKRYI